MNSTSFECLFGVLSFGSFAALLQKFKFQACVLNKYIYRYERFVEMVLVESIGLVTSCFHFCEDLGKVTHVENLIKALLNH